MLKVQISIIHVLLRESESYVSIVLIMIWANAIHHRLYFFRRCGQLNSRTKQMEWLPLSQVLYDSDQDLVKIQISLIQVLILKWFGQMPSFIICSVSLAEVAN